MSPAHQQPSFQQCREHQPTRAFSLKPPRAPVSRKPPRAPAHASLLPQAATRTSTREPSPSSRHAHQHAPAFSLKPPRAPAHASFLPQATTRTSAYLSFASLQPAHTTLIANINFNYTLCAAMTLPTLTDTCATHNERSFLISLQLPANSLLIFSRLC